MAKLAKLLSSASSAGGAGLDVDDVFSTYLYEGTSASHTIDNGIDLDGEGGLWVTKNRDQLDAMQWSSTEQDLGKSLESSSNGVPINLTDFTLPSAGGYTINTTNDRWNTSGENYVSWTFRKAPKFFDCFVYTGSSSGSQTISHNLGVAPAFAIIKRTDSNGDWGVYSAFGGSNSDDCSLKLNEPESELSPIAFTSTSTSITVFSSSFKIDANINGATYVAYLFANNNGDGEFGPTQDQDIIKVGGYSGLATVNLGFEPQWLLVKNTSATGDWFIFDTMRGLTVDSFGTTDKVIYTNELKSEESRNYFDIRQDGFKAIASPVGSGTYVYIAIRRGPLTAPTSSSEVFAANGWAGSNVVPNIVSGFPVDMIINRTRTVVTSTENSSRLTQGAFLETNTNDKENNNSNYGFDYQDGYYGANTNSNFISWMWKRAPGYFDVVPYTATGTATMTLNHNLGVVPEMMWIKRTHNTSGGGTSNWMVYHKDFDYTYSYAYLSTSAAVDSTQTNTWPSAPTTTQLTVGSWTGDFIGGGDTGLVFLFASRPNVSKIGSYIGNGTNKTIDCGFSNGAKFVLIKNVSAGRWSVFDSYRGIVAGNDPQLFLDNTEVEDTGHDLIDTTPSGFIVNSDPTTGGTKETNILNDNYIFYAIAAP